MAPAGYLSTCLNTNGIIDSRGRDLSAWIAGPCWPSRAPQSTSAPRHVRTLSCCCQDVTVAGHVTDTLSDVLTWCQRPVCIALLDVQPPLAYRTLPLLHHWYEDCFQMA